MRQSGFKRITAGLALGSGVTVAVAGACFASEEWPTFLGFGVFVWLLGGFSAKGKYLSSMAVGRFQKDDGSWETDEEVEARRRSRPAAPILHFLWPFARHAQD